MDIAVEILLRAVNETVTIGVSSKLYQFAPQVIDLNDNLTDLNFIARE